MSESVRVKVCGLRSLENSLECVEAGVDMLGFNFWPGSKRHISFEQAAGWLGALAGKVERVGLFVNAGKEEILRVSSTGLVDLVQLHGDESPEFCHELASGGLRVMRAIRVGSETDIDDVADYPGDRILLDASVPGHYGGSGKSFDWNVARRASERFTDRKILLSGGLKPENVAQAVAQARPWGIDVASGVESAPGFKDVKRVKELLENLG
ncbi:MAG: phosphoribosylanthranilate isomerase [Verrucomicrobiota bacterium]